MFIVIGGTTFGQLVILSVCQSIFPLSYFSRKYLNNNEIISVFHSLFYCFIVKLADRSGVVSGKGVTEARLGASCVS